MGLASLTRQPGSYDVEINEKVSFWNKQHDLDQNYWITAKRFCIAKFVTVETLWTHFQAIHQKAKMGEKNNLKIFKPVRARIFSSKNT